jgi:Arc/MetJ-type ribon-helix-helix transcriptional regulator
MRMMTERQRSTMVSIRLPRDLEDMVDAYAETRDASFSEAVRELLVRALDGIGASNTVTDENDGTREDRGWARDSA